MQIFKSPEDLAKQLETWQKMNMDAAQRTSSTQRDQNRYLGRASVFKELAEGIRSGEILLEGWK